MISNTAAHQRYDDLAIGVRLEAVRLLEALPQLAMVVDFAVDGKNDLAIGAHKRLSSGL